MSKIQSFLLFIHISTLMFIVGFVIYKIETKFHLFGRIKCKFGIHKRTKKEKGQKVKTYKCTICNKAKNHPHLKIVDGGKKDIRNTFKW